MIFTLDKPPPDVLFIGGTSLSTIYGVIDRFSDDVNLSFDRAGFGFGGADDPMQAGSNKKQTPAVERLAEACKVAVRGKLRPQLVQAFEKALGTTTGWTRDSAADVSDDATLLFRYPSAPITSSSWLSTRTVPTLWRWPSATVRGATGCK